MIDMSIQNTKRKEFIPAVDTSAEGMEQKQEFDIQRQSIESELADRYSSDMVKLLKRLSYELAVIGLPLEDACLIVGLDYEKVQNLISIDKTVERLIKLKDLEYKRGLLEVVSVKSKTDDKLSLWMLERRYPAEFNPRKGGGGGDPDEGDNIVKQAITFIQVNGDSTPLVARKAKNGGYATDNGSEKGGIKQKIMDLLS